MSEVEEYRCTVAVTLEVIGGKWKSLVLWHLREKTLRFSQLQRRLARVTQKMLTQQLRDLERDGLVHRQVYAEVPPRVEYSLTDLGRSVIPILNLMCDWGREFDQLNGREETSEAIQCQK
ncbi:MAG: HxlR family transcriptional regulator [Desulfuromonadales bacterium C00003068]|jgi:DNA-binding HxlR family transcriptional regulator|nr:MAG: HxlR family transcriptional regulator [Desulfuromonadales bacterium C00003068]